MPEESNDLFGTPLSAAGKRKGKPTSKPAASVDDSGLPRNLAKAVPVKVPDFSDPKRPKTCLEVDFPILPINALSALEGNAGKPIYQMSKWWARRRSCIFRALLIAAAMEAPTKKHADGQPMLGPDGRPMVDEDAAAAAVWDVYYANHQAAGNFKDLSVLDPFMGGGTTLVEGSRLGFKVSGVDLNPVAWFIVKNELACTDPAEVKAFFDQIEAEVKPQIQPFYVTDGVGGKKGTWFKVAADGVREKMPTDFDPCNLPPEDRKPYQYEGPEIIYTFWAKHGPCIKPGCGHRTPIFRSPVVAIKQLGVKYIPCTCKNKNCGIDFHAELGDARIAPDAEHVVLDNDTPYSVLSAGFTKRLMEYGQGGKGDKEFRIRELSDMVENESGFKCPGCSTWSGQRVRDVLAMHRGATRTADIDKKHLGILPARNGKKPVYCTLLVDPEWLKGSPGIDGDGNELGGYIDAPVEATEKWYHERLKNLRLIEARGKIGGEKEPAGEGGSAEPGAAEIAEERADENIWLPPVVRLADGREINTRTETIARKANGKEWDSHFVCGACGMPQDFRLSVQATRRTAPVASYAIQAFASERKGEDHPYGGRFFKAPGEADAGRAIAAEREWAARRDTELRGHWPRDEVPVTYMTHQANFALPEQGYTHWFKMFSARQLIVHASLIRAVASGGATEMCRDHGLGAVQQYLRNQNGFCIWDIGYDKLAPFFSNSNYAPKVRFVENSIFGTLGRGSWSSCAEGVMEGVEWAASPWEAAPLDLKQA